MLFIDTCGVNNDFDTERDGPNSATSLVDKKEMERIIRSKLDFCLGGAQNDEESVIVRNCCR